MSLNNTTADALAATIVTGLGLVEPQYSQALANFKIVCRAFYAALKTDAVVGITSVSGVTTGGGVSGPGSGALS